MKLDIDKWRKCFRSKEGHSFKQRSIQVVPENRLPFRGETVILQALECQKCGEKRVLVIQKGDPKWNDYNYKNIQGKLDLGLKEV